MKTTPTYDPIAAYRVNHVKRDQPAEYDPIATARLTVVSTFDEDMASLMAGLARNARRDGMADIAEIRRQEEAKFANRHGEDNNNEG